MIKDYLIPVLIVVAGLIVYNMLVKKFLPASFEENYEVNSATGEIMRAA